MNPSDADPNSASVDLAGKASPSAEQRPVQLNTDQPHRPDESSRWNLGVKKTAGGTDRNKVLVLTWIALAALAALGLSALVSLALGAILGVIGRELGEAFEAELWTYAPPARAKVPSPRG